MVVCLYVMRSRSFYTNLCQKWDVTFVLSRIRTLVSVGFVFSPGPEVVVNVPVDQDNNDDRMTEHEDDLDVEQKRIGARDWQPSYTVRGLNLK